MMYISKFAWFQPQELHTKRETNRVKNPPTNSITQLASKPLTSHLNLKSKFCKGKGKAIPLQAWSGTEGSRKLRFPDFMTTVQGGGKVVSLTHRPHLPPGNSPGTHFCLRLSRPQGQSAIGRIMSMKIPMTPSRIEPATFRFVAQHLNHCATAVPNLNSVPKLFMCLYMLINCTFSSICYFISKNGRDVLSHPLKCQAMLPELITKYSVRVII